MNGLTATGKSTTARRLSNHFDLNLFQTCAIRAQKFGRAATISEEERAWVYDEMFRLASEIIENANGIIFDGSFYKRMQRLRAYKWALEHNLYMVIIQCICPNKVLIIQRIENRIGKTSPEAEACSMKDYYHWEKQAESINGDLFMSDMLSYVLTYNTEANIVDLSHHYSHKVLDIATYLVSTWPTEITQEIKSQKITQAGGSFRNNSKWIYERMPLTCPIYINRNKVFLK